jgi:hypothetical protein
MAVNSLTVAAAVVVGDGVGAGVGDGVDLIAGVLVAPAVGFAGEPHDTSRISTINEAHAPPHLRRIISPSHS